MRRLVPADRARSSMEFLRCAGPRGAVAPSVPTARSPRADAATAPNGHRTGALARSWAKAQGCLVQTLFGQGGRAHPRAVRGYERFRNPSLLIMPAQQVLVFQITGDPETAGGQAMSALCEIYFKVGGVL